MVTRSVQINGQMNAADQQPKKHNAFAGNVWWRRHKNTNSKSNSNMRCDSRLQQYDTSTSEVITI